MKQEKKIEQRFLKAYDEYADAIFRHCYFRVYNRELAQELMQETFMKVWKYLGEGKKVDNIRAFLYKVATNLIIDHSRKKQESSLDEMLEAGFQPGEDTREKIANIFEAKQLVALLDDLEEQYREVLMLRYIDDLSPREIAEMLDEKENTISVRIHRAVKKAKKCIEEQIHEQEN